MHSQKLVVLNHVTYVGMKLDDTGEYNSDTNKHEGDNIKKKLWDDIWDEREAWGLKMDRKQIMWYSGYLVWKSCGLPEVLLIKQNDGNLVTKVIQLTCYNL